MEPGQNSAHSCLLNTLEDINPFSSLAVLQLDKWDSEGVTLLGNN
jgi:hypothetical protein